MRNGDSISKVAYTTDDADQEIPPDHARASLVQGATQSAAPVASDHTSYQHSNGGLRPSLSSPTARNHMEGQSYHQDGVNPLSSYAATFKGHTLNRHNAHPSAEPSVASRQDPLPLIGETVSSVRNPLTSSQSFFLTDSSGKQRKSDFMTWPIPDILLTKKSRLPGIVVFLVF